MIIERIMLIQDSTCQGADLTKNLASKSQEIKEAVVVARGSRAIQNLIGCNAYESSTKRCLVSKFGFDCTKESVVLPSQLTEGAKL